MMRLSRNRAFQVGAWLLGLTVCGLAIAAWGDNLGWHFTPLNAYVIFPVLGLTAYSLLWTTYVVGAVREVCKLNESLFSRYLRATGWVILVLICLHPGLLIYQRFRDGFGWPPGSYESYVASGLGWVTLLGSVSLLIFLAYELYRFFGRHSWWRYVLVAVDIAMLAIFYHGLRLGTEISHGWFRGVWWFYGITLVLILAHSYSRRLQQVLQARKARR